MIGFRIAQNELNDIMRRFQRYNGDTQRKIDIEIKKSALRISTKAKVLSPVNTGRLRSSIHWLFKGMKTNYRYTDSEGNTFTGDLGIEVKRGAVVGTNVNYAESVENGDVRTKNGRQPFLKPAYQQDMPKLLEGIKRIFN